MNKEEKTKPTLKELWSDKRTKAMLKLGIWGIFIIMVIIYINVINRPSEDLETIKNDNIINKLHDNNYAFNTQISIFDGNNYQIYTYSGKVFGNTALIDKTLNDKTTKYYIKGNNYYLEEENNYILVDKNSLFDVVDAKYLDVKNIKNYMKRASVSDNQYKVYLKDIVLNNNTSEYIIIDIYKDTINIDYSSLIKLTDPNIISYTVKLEFSKIGEINDLAS